MNSTLFHVIGNFIREQLLQIPLLAVRALFVAIPVLILIWVLRLPRAETIDPQGTGRWDGNLKLWAGLALVIQIAIYCAF